MIVVLKHNVPEEKRNQLINWLRNQNIDVHPSLGEYQTVLGLVGDTSRIDMSLLESLDIVDSVKRVSDPFKCCNRKFHPDDTVVSVGDGADRLCRQGCQGRRRAAAARRRIQAADLPL